MLMRTVLLVAALSGSLFAAEGVFDPLPAVDLFMLSPRDFTDAELDLPYYLAHFRQFADAVIAEGPNRGFIGISVWRGQTGDKKPYNARVMENILSLAYFYTLDRPWNPYYRSTPVRQRLEAALDFWCRIQSPDGKFSEYGPQQWNLAATAFATKFMGRSLTLLKTGPPIDAELHRRAIEADRKAIRIVLTDPALYEHGKRYSNQFTNVWAGALAFLNIYPDPELEAHFWKRLPDALRDFQSPAGFFYEADGPDAGYSSSTHQSNLRVSYIFTRGTSRAEPFLEHEKNGVYILCLTSNPGAGDFQLNQDLYLRVARKVAQWNTRGNCGMVVGATKPQFLTSILAVAPDVPLLIPGLGTQGGDLEAILSAAPNLPLHHLLFNVSRSIIYAADDASFGRQARLAELHERASALGEHGHLSALRGDVETP
jgi:hypothetical protein